MTRWPDHLHDVLPTLLLLAVASGPSPLPISIGAHTMPAPVEPTPHGHDPGPPVQLVDAGDGVHLHPDQIAAAYMIGPHLGGAWTDMPEARPRSRARSEVAVTVVIDTDGTLHHPDEDGLEVDRYEGDGYADVRREGEERWARIDATRGDV